MSEEDGGDFLLRKMKDCTKAICGESGMIKAVILAVATCPLHEHDFAVLMESQALVVSPATIACLETRGVKL